MPPYGACAGSSAYKRAYVDHMRRLTLKEQGQCWCRNIAVGCLPPRITLFAQFTRKALQSASGFGAPLVILMNQCRTLLQSFAHTLSNSSSQQELYYEFCDKYLFAGLAACLQSIRPRQWAMVRQVHGLTWCA